MLQFNTFSCWIQVDGVPLPEYQIENSLDSGGESVSCWIPSEIGKAFQICYSDSERALTTGSVAIVDGQRCGGKILYSKHDRPTRNSVTIQKGTVTSETSYRPFVFSNCQLVDDDNLLDQSPDIGQIEVVIDEVCIFGSKPSRSIALAPLQIHERAKKGITHGIQLGREVVEKQHPTRKSKSLRKIVTFVFNYRPLDVLMAEDIVPRPGKVALDVPRPLSNALDSTLKGEYEELKPHRSLRNLNGRVKIEIKQEVPVDVIIDLTV